MAGRDQRENELLEHHARPEDMIIRMADAQGPVVLLKGKGLNESLFALAGGLAQWFSKNRSDAPQRVEYYPAGQGNSSGHVTAVKISDDDLKMMER